MTPSSSHPPIPQRGPRCEGRPLVIYHHPCADGFSAAWCFWRAYGADADFVPAKYGEQPPEMAGRDVYLVDFSYARPVVEQMLRAARSVTLIDHHQTAIEQLRPLFRQDSYTGGEPQLNHYVDIHRSGAGLAWDYLFPNVPRPLLLGHVEDRDLWRFKLPGTREVQAYVFSHPYSFETWDRLMAADQAELMSMTAAGAAIERKHRKDVAELLSVCTRRMLIGGYLVRVACMPYTMASDAGAALAEGAPFGATYYDTREERVFSLRSIAPYGHDVARIAESYGGGGHQHAAGFRVPRGHRLAIV